MVCQDIHRRFGVPIARLEFVRSSMLQPDADHLSEAIRRMALLGVGVWLITDLEEVFVMESELQFRDLVAANYLGAENEHGYILVNLTPLVNRLLALAGDDKTIKPHGRGYEILKELKAMTEIQSQPELRVLEAIRGKDVQRVELSLTDGRVVTIRTVESLDSATDLQKLLDEYPYQRVTLNMKNGKVVHISREATEKIDE